MKSRWLPSLLKNAVLFFASSLVFLLLAFSILRSESLVMADQGHLSGPDPIPHLILVKFKPAAAAAIESSLPLSSLQISDISSHTELPAFLRHFAKIQNLRPLHNHIVAEKIRTGRSGLLHAADIQSKFSRRSRGHTESFNPPDLSRTYILESIGASPNELQSIADQLNKDPSIEYAEVERFRRLQMAPNDPHFTNGDLWGMVKIAAPQAWDISTGTGVVVADIDTGVDPAHQDLQANIGPGWNYYNNSAVLTDGYGHGTHTAGTILAVGNNGLGVIGEAFNARLMPVKVCSDTGSCPDSYIAAGIEWAADHGAQVANISLGGPGYSQTLEDALAYAHNLNVVLVAAATNASANLDTLPAYPASSGYVITVSASDSSDNLASFSNFGNKIDVAAPGVGIWSTLPGNSYGSWNGTSMATPHVTGLAALILSLRSGLSNEQVRQIIRASADDVGPPGWDTSFGYGRINAYKALQISGSSSIPIVYGLYPVNGIVGQGDSTVTLTGVNFVPGSVVQWNYLPLATTYVNSSQLTAVIPAADLQSASLFNRIRALNPGVGPSNEQNFPVMPSGQKPSLSLLNPISAVAGSASFTLTVQGGNFLSTSVVQWNGQSLATHFLTVDIIQASVPASLVAAPGNSTITVLNNPPGGGASANSLNFVITTSALQPVITSPLSSTARQGQPFNYHITATQNPTSFNAISLPSGLVVYSTGSISGMPTTNGLFNVTLSATNSAGFTGTAALALNVLPPLPPPPVVTSLSTATGVVGSAFQYQITGTNNPTYFNAWITSGPLMGLLPAWLTINRTTGLLSGTPTVQETDYLTMSAGNDGGGGIASLTLTINAAGSFLICDVNQDGVTNVLDVQLEANQALGISLCTNDINKDGLCNILDVQRVVNNALGSPCVSP